MKNNEKMTFSRREVYNSKKEALKESTRLKVQEVSKNGAFKNRIISKKIIKKQL